MASFVDSISIWIEICKNCSIVIFFDHIKSFRWLVWGVFWSVLKMCPFFSAIEISNIGCCCLTMQFNFILYVRVSSSVSFVGSIDEITPNSSENHTDRFPTFLMLTVCWCSTSFTAIVFFKNNNRAFYCNCSSVAPLLPESFFWLAGTRKNKNILSCIHVLDLVFKIFQI